MKSRVWLGLGSALRVCQGLCYRGPGKRRQQAVTASAAGDEESSVHDTLRGSVNGKGCAGRGFPLSFWRTKTPVAVVYPSE